MTSLDNQEVLKFTVYKTINLLNGMIYIGKHQTKNPDDEYLGSGKRLKYAIKKYGIENFKKEVLFIFESEEEMNSKEAELVTEEFCSRDDTYNLCPGGHGGWGYVNIHVNSLESLKKNGSLGGLATKGRFRKPMTSSHKNKISQSLTGKSLSENTKKKISKANIGKTPNKGKKWINNGITHKMIFVDGPLPEGWKFGSLIKMSEYWKSSDKK